MSFTDNFGNPKGLIGRMMLVTMDREHLPMAEWAFEQIEIPQEGYILDIGCGGGYNIRRMLGMSENGKLIGLDISEESVRKAKKINSAELGKRVKIIQGSAEKLPCKNESTDLVTAFETVFFWKDVDLGFGNVYRCLKNGGSFAVINNYGDPKIDWEKKVPCMTRYTADDIKAKMETAGFADVTVSKKDNLFLVLGRKEQSNNG
ncbi:MAG: class I SAM-dependent methyltransferase [Ruminococcus sp.]|nr:class I SAM-dependent methyltransferase [Ruminococcus sp.]